MYHYPDTSGLLIGELIGGDGGGTKLRSDIGRDIYIVDKVHTHFGRNDQIFLVIPAVCF